MTLNLEGTWRTKNGSIVNVAQYYSDRDMVWWGDIMTEHGLKYIAWDEAGNSYMDPGYDLVKRKRSPEDRNF